MVRNSSCSANRFESALAASDDLLVGGAAEAAGGRRSVSRRINLARREFTSALVLICSEGVSDAPPSFNSNSASRDSIRSNGVGGGGEVLMVAYALQSDLLNY